MKYPHLAREGLKVTTHHSTNEALSSDYVKAADVEAVLASRLRDWLLLRRFVEDFVIALEVPDAAVEDNPNYSEHE